MIAGCVGGFAGNPADIVNIRMQADGKRPVAERRNYKHAIDGLIRITKSEGALSLWSGLSPNLVRAMFITSGQLASYDIFKAKLLATPYFQDNITTHFTASLMAGFVATAVTAPVDVIKTRIMNAPANQFRGLIDCGIKVFRAEGARGFVKGFVPAYVRLGPHTILTFLVFEKLKVWQL